MNQLCPTRNELFLFYSALKLQARQYGILLKPLEQLTEGESICPLNEKTCDNAVSTYKEMTGMLYQKLSQENIFGTSYKYAKQVIEIHAHDHDGFKVITKLLQKIHPRLNPNCEAYKIPVFNDCANIHSFVKNYRTFLKYEQLKTRPREYSNKEQVTYVLDQLDDRFNDGIVQTKALMNNYLHAEYPPELLVDEDLVDTILKYIPEDQQDNLENDITGR